jgi:D-alanine-D-alanine ligase
LVRKIRVGVIFGGRSGEHEVSLRSARAVIENLDRNKYEAVPVAISKQGRWLGPGESIALLPSSSSRLISKRVSNGTNGTSVAVIGDPSHKGLITLGDSSRKVQPIDVVFPVLHGTYGEDGTIQGLLEMASLPYVGCGVLASSCGMDKVTMKALFHEAGLPICRHTWFLRSQWEAEPRRILNRVASEIGFPCFVKPANLGSSVGISRADDKDGLKRAIELAIRYDRRIIVEEGLDAREIECGVLGNDEPIASLPGEYIVKDKSAAFLDYTEKYSSTGHVEFVVPAPISKSLKVRIQKMATTAFSAIDGAGLARVDFFLRRDSDELLINEVNTLPGLTDVSGYPKMWEASGLSFSELLDRLIELAFDRHREKARNETSI